MAAAARAAGAEIRERCAVERILVRDGRVDRGRDDASKRFPAATVVSGVDPRTTFLRLIDPQELAPDVLAKLETTGPPARWRR